MLRGEGRKWMGKSKTFPFHFNLFPINYSCLGDPPFMLGVQQMKNSAVNWPKDSALQQYSSPRAGTSSGGCPCPHQQW